MAKVIGLTGSFGTGKTFAASVFRSFGAGVIDADKIARSAIAKGTPVYDEVVRTFGSDIVDARGEIDRSRLAGIVFADKKALSRLNRIVHPYVIAMIKDRIRRSGPDDLLVIDAPLLVEAHLTKMVDALVVVKCARKRQIERCMRKFRMDRGEVMKRISSQMPIREKAALADFVVDNGGSRSQTRKRIRKIWEEMVWR